MEHGFEQKFGDAKSGRPAEEKYAEVLLIHQSLMSGEWNRTATPDRTPEILSAVAAMMKLKYDPETGELSGTVNGKKGTLKPTEEQVKTWAANAEVKVKIQEQRLAKAKAAVDASNEKLVIELS